MENKGIGPTEVLSVMGLSKRKSRMQLFLEKVGEVKKEAKEPSILHDEMQRLLANEFRKKDFDRDDVPMDHLIRLQHNMKVFGYQKSYLAVLIGGRTFLHCTVEREEVICDTIVDACRQFWKHIEEDTMPEMDGSTASEQFLKQRYPEGDGETHLPKEAMQLIEQFQRAKAKEEEAKEEKNQAVNKIKGIYGWIRKRNHRHEAGHMEKRLHETSGRKSVQGIPPGPVSAVCHGTKLQKIWDKMKKSLPSGRFSDIIEAS